MSITTTPSGTVKNTYFAVFFEFSMRAPKNEGGELDPFSTISAFTDAVHARLAKETPRLPSNRVDDFPGVSVFEICVNDGEVEEIDAFGDEIRYEYGFYWYGDQDWVTQGRSQALQKIVQDAIAQQIEDGNAPEGVNAIRMGKTETRKEIVIRHHEVFQSEGKTLFTRTFGARPKP